MKTEEQYERSHAVAAVVAGSCFILMFVLILLAAILNGCQP